MHTGSSKPLEVLLTTKWGRSVWITLGTLILAIIAAVVLAGLFLARPLEGADK